MSKDPLDSRPDRNHKPRVLIDLDGVVRDFIGSLIRVYRTVYPDHEIQPVTSRALEKYFPVGEGVYRFFKPGYIEQIMTEAPAYPGAVEALQKWQEKYKLVIVTAQSEMSRSSTYHWLWRFKIPADEVHITYYKADIPGEALLDDFTDNLEEFAATGRRAVCLNQPWNHEWSGPRVNSVQEFFEYLDQRLK